MANPIKPVLRVSVETKHKIKDAALKSGRTLAQEAEFRIEQSFAIESLAKWLLDVANDGAEAV